MIVIRIITMLAVYTISLFVLQSTSVHVSLAKYLDSPFYANLVFIGATLLLLLIAFPNTQSMAKTLYTVCILFFSLAALGYAKLDWISYFILRTLQLDQIVPDLQSSHSETELTLFGTLIIGGCLIINYTIIYQDTAANLTERGIPPKEVNFIMFKQGALFLGLMLVVTMLAISFIVTIPFTEPLIESIALYLMDNPSALALLGIIIFLTIGLLVIRETRSLIDEKPTTNN